MEKKYGFIFVAIFVSIFVMGSVSALTWRNNGTDNMVLDDAGNLTVTKNITTTQTGFFGFLGSLINRITKLFVQDIDFAGTLIGGSVNISASDGNIVSSGNITADYFIGDGGKLTNLPEGSLGTSINTTEIEDGTISAKDIGVDAINTSHILDNNITDVKIDSLNWTKLTDVPAGFGDDIDNNTLYYAGGVYIYKNGSDYFVLNETKLNATIDNRISGIDTIWNISGSLYVINSSGILEINETKLNITIDNRMLLNDTNGVYIYDSGKKIYLNETRLNATIDARTPATDLSDYALKNQSETFAGNITTTQTGFFGWLGSLTNRITKLFVQDIDFTGTINGTGNIITIGNISADYFIGDGSQLSNVNGSSQWVTNGNDIYYNDGKVGIGTSNPGHELEVVGSINVTQNITFSGVVMYLEGNEWIIDY